MLEFGDYSLSKSGVDKIVIRDHAFDKEKVVMIDDFENLLNVIINIRDLSSDDENFEIVKALVYDPQTYENVDTLYFARYKNTWSLCEDGSTFASNDVSAFLNDDKDGFEVPWYTGEPTHNILYIDGMYGIYDDNMNCLESSKTVFELNLSGYNFEE